MITFSGFVSLTVPFKTLFRSHLFPNFYAPFLTSFVYSLLSARCSDRNCPKTQKVKMESLLLRYSKSKPQMSHDGYTYLESLTFLVNEKWIKPYNKSHISATMAVTLFSIFLPVSSTPCLCLAPCEWST